MLRLLLASLLLIMTTTTCSQEKRYQRRRRQLNETAELITRRSDEQHFAIIPLKRRALDPYPWVTDAYTRYQTITKEHLRCRGNRLNPPIIKEDDRGTVVRLADCQGGRHHSLPLQDGEEFVYPILLDLLNEVQEKTGQRVVVTCGHRCPDHNRYADDTRENLYSKHQIGAEVDFYVQGMEEDPETVLSILFDYYQRHYSETPTLRDFARYEKSDTNVRTQPWYNKEVFIKLYHVDEGRDLDNRHPYPYIGIQVRWDRDQQRRVSYNWDQAYRNYLKE